jgi:hypothetical protein
MLFAEFAWVKSGVCVGEEFARDLGWALAGVKLYYASTKPLLL